MATSIETNLTKKVIEEPADLPPGASAAALRRWNKQCDLAAIAEDKLNRNIQKLFAVALAQCSESLISKLEAQHAYAAVKTAKDGLGLLRIVRRVMQEY